MSKEQLDRIEEQLSQLMEIVAGNNKAINHLEKRFDGMELRFDGLEQLSDSEKQLNQQRHEQLLKEIRNQTFDIDYLRDKVSRNDMEIHKITQMQIVESEFFK